VLGGRAARDAAIARTEAIAAWTEMVRDSIVAASGLVADLRLARELTARSAKRTRRRQA
jgi:hypothetical protein